MVCSTAAKSIIRLSQCLSIQSSLQMKCLMMLRPTDFTYLKTTFPGLRYLTKSLLTDILRNGQGKLLNFKCILNNIIHFNSFLSTND